VRGLPVLAHSYIQFQMFQQAMDAKPNEFFFVERGEELHGKKTGSPIIMLENWQLNLRYRIYWFAILQRFEPILLTDAQRYPNIPTILLEDLERQG
jgi:hypothetical protein